MSKYENGFYLQVKVNGDQSIIEKSGDEWLSLGSDIDQTDYEMEAETVLIRRIERIIDDEGIGIVLMGS